MANEVQFGRTTGGKLERSVAPVRLVRLFDVRRISMKGWQYQVGGWSDRVMANEVQYSRTGGNLERSVAPVRLVRLFDVRRMVIGSLPMKFN